jgi:hypothetical protein
MYNRAGGALPRVAGGDDAATRGELVAEGLLRCDAANRSGPRVGFADGQQQRAVVEHLAEGR